MTLISVVAVTPGREFMKYSGWWPETNQEPGLEQGGRGIPQLPPSGPRLPLILQKPKTAHLASKLTLVTSGFLYSFFLLFIIIKFFLDPGSRPPPADLAGMTFLDGHGGPSHQHRGPPY